MLTGLKIVMIGGDARQLEVIEYLSQWDAALTLIGFNQLEQSYNGAIKAELTEEVLKTADALVLPVVAMDDDGRVESIFASQPIVLNEQHIAALPEHAAIYTGISRPKLSEWCRKYGRKCIELLERDDVAIYNSIPTAEGAVMMAIQNTDFTIHGAKCLVVGFGRTGQTMARMLKGMGAQVSVAARRPEYIARIIEQGYRAVPMDSLVASVEHMDIVFNTVPDLVVTSQVIARLPHHALIIDLASKPGGTDFRFAEKRGIKALLAPGLPGIVAPKTAGQILAKTLKQLLSEQLRKRG